MAKGTNTHGGKRLNSGRKSKSVLEKTESGNPGHRPLKVIDVPDAIEGVEMEGVDMPEPAEFLSATQRDGSTLQAGDIYKNTWTTAFQSTPKENRIKLLRDIGVTDE